jgi:hypothetical protein
MSTKSSALKVLPCLDSSEMALACRQQLAISRAAASDLGYPSVEAVHSGYYRTGSGETVDWSMQVRHACAAKLSIAPEMPLPVPDRAPCAQTRVQVCNQTTFQASLRLIQASLRPLALNFANGIHPG